MMDEHVEFVSHTGVFRCDDGVLEHVEEVP